MYVENCFVAVAELPAGSVAVTAKMQFPTVVGAVNVSTVSHEANPRTGEFG